MKAHYSERNFIFKRPGGTSRGVLHEKKSWFIILEHNGFKGIGECNPLKGLSIDDREGFEDKLIEVTTNIDLYASDAYLLSEWPSIRFGLEMALKDLANGGKRLFFENDFSQQGAGIPINGLVWMGEKSFMKEQIDHLLSRGFSCIKMKVGAIKLEEELELLTYIRKNYPIDSLTLRVDANGAFHASKVLEILKRLSDFDLHSIEQPIQQGQTEEMAKLCDLSPIPIALDEELIGVLTKAEKASLLSTINPPYIILKPSLLGGFSASEEWIKEADILGINWWITSALESNIGLNAISQWTYELNAKGHQGLGTGSLYTNNIPSPLEIIGEHIYYIKDKHWETDDL